LSGAAPAAACTCHRFECTCGSRSSVEAAAAELLAPSSSSAAAEADADGAAGDESLVGQTVRKCFKGYGTYDGRVVSLRDAKPNARPRQPALYTVRYSDGESEELEAYEVRALTEGLYIVMFPRLTCSPMYRLQVRALMEGGGNVKALQVMRMLVLLPSVCWLPVLMPVLTPSLLLCPAEAALLLRLLRALLPTGRGAQRGERAAAQ